MRSRSLPHRHVTRCCRRPDRRTSETVDVPDPESKGGAHDRRRELGGDRGRRPGPVSVLDRAVGLRGRAGRPVRSRAMARGAVFGGRPISSWSCGRPSRERPPPSTCPRRTGCFTVTPSRQRSRSLTPGAWISAAAGGPGLGIAVMFNDPEGKPLRARAGRETGTSRRAGPLRLLDERRPRRSLEQGGGG